jgi:Ca-activated chloride channel family protein
VIAHALLFSLGLAVGAREAQNPPSDPVSVVVTAASDAHFPEIAVDFEVRRPDGSFVLDATRDQFQVSEDGTAHEVLEFEAPVSRQARPTTVVLVVDRSGSMKLGDRIGGLRRAVASFLAGLPRGSRVAVVAFGTEVDLVCPFTADFGRVQTAVDRLRPVGATRFYDAVAAALDLVGLETGRRAVLALTDGEDTASEEASPESVARAARTAGLPVHTLGLGSDDETAAAALRSVAEATRGQFYSAREADELRAIYEEIAQRLRSSYSLTYRTDRRIPDGTLRTVRVAYRGATAAVAGEVRQFIPGMVVPAANWSPLFLALLGGLLGLAVLARRF